MKRRYRIKQEDGSTPRLATVWVEDNVGDDGLDAPLLRDERTSRVITVASNERQHFGYALVVEARGGKKRL